MNFDEIIDRRGSGSYKWEKFPELDPYWVADMDFRTPDCVLDAVRKFADFGILGYAHAHASMNGTLISYMESRHGVAVKESEIVHLGGLVVALSLAARAFCDAGDSVMTCSPIYPPFLGVANDAGAETIAVRHTMVEGKFTFDWEMMEEAVTPKTKVFLLCNPQNPLGRSFTAQEVTQVAEFCQRHDLVLVSDEVHCDLVYNEDEQKFFSALHLEAKYHEKLIVLQSPSKTYNIAGMGYAFAVIPNDSVRRRFTQAEQHTLPEINCIAFYAAEAAYRDGEPWRQALLTYLRKNRDTFTDFIRTEMPYLKVPDMEATYLGWIDCSALPLENAAQYLEKDAGLFLSDGAFFGVHEAIRFNFGCPHSRVLEGLEKIKASFMKLNV